MTEQLLWQLCNEQVQFFGELLAAREPDQSEVRGIDELEEMLPALSRLASSVQQVLIAIRKAAAEGRIEGIQETGEDCDELLVACGSLCLSIQDRCLGDVKSVEASNGLSELSRISDLFRQMRATWIRDWPFIDQEMIERTAIESVEGKYQKAKDVLHELRNLHH